MVAEPDLAELLRLGKRPGQDEAVWRGRGLHASGQPVDLEVKIRRLADGDEERGTLLVVRAVETVADPLRVLIDELPAFVAFVDSGLNYCIVNRSYERWLGRPRNEIEGKPVADIVVPEKRDQILGLMKRALAGESLNFTIEAPDLTGQQRRFEVNYSPSRSASGTTQGLFVFAHDITERTRMEEQLRASNQRWLALLENNPDQVLLLDRDGTVRYINRIRSGLALEQVVNTRGVDFIVPEQRPNVLAILEQVWTTGERRDFEVESNTTVPNSWHSCRVAALRRDGETIGLLAVIRDITEQKRHSAALRESERRLRAVFEQTFELVSLLDREGAILELNRPHLAFLGIVEAEAIGLRLWDAPCWNRTPEVQDRLRQAVAAAAQGTPARFEVGVSDSGRHARIFDVVVKPVRGDSGAVVFVLAEARDVTEQRRTESDLAEREHLLRSVGENLPGLTIYQLVREQDGTKRFTFISAGAERLTGAGREAVLRDPSVLYRLIHEDDRMKVALAEEESARNLAPFDIVVRMRRPDGEVRWSHLRSAPRRLPGGGVQWDGVELDITDLKRAEEQRLAYHQQLLDLQKYESIGVLAGGVAHDFNNHLTAIVGNASLARLDLPVGSEMHACLEQVESIAMRAADLCKQLLNYAGKGRIVLQPVALNDLLLEIEPRLILNVPTGVRLTLQLGERLPSLQADPGQLRQVVLSLVANAAESIAEKAGDIVVSTCAFRLDEDYRTKHRLEVEPDGRNYICLRVRDGGCGIAPERIGRIFEPFYTTKFMGRGLGLAAVLGIVRSHHGLITVDSELGRGTVVDVLLPCDPSPVPVASVKAVSPPATWRGHGAILVVEDEAAVRTTTARMLEVIGFQAVQAADGRDGLIKFHAYPDAYRLVLLDLAMPYVSGEEVLAQIKLLRPNLPVIIISGYGKQQVMPQFPVGHVAGFLEKPFRMETLMASIQRILS